MGVQWKKEKNKMTKFNYKKWVTDHKNGKPLFEQATGSYYCNETDQTCSTTPPINQTAYAVYPDLQTCEDNCPPVPVGPPTAVVIPNVGKISNMGKYLDK